MEEDNQHSLLLLVGIDTAVTRGLVHRIQVGVVQVYQAVRVEPYPVTNKPTGCARGRSDVVDGEEMSNPTMSNNDEKRQQL